MLRPTEQRTKEAFRRLASDADFQEIMAWIQFSIAELDAANRSQLDGVVLRMQQGGAQALSELVEHASGRSRAIAQPMVTSRTPGLT